MASTPSTVTTELQEIQFKAEANLRVRSLWGDAFRRLVRNRLSMAGLFIFSVLVFMAALGPTLAPYPYMLQDLNRVAEPPSRDHLLGTDDLGRDMLSRILYGARTAAIVAVVTTVMSFTIGVILGSVGAYLGGWADWVVTRLIDIAQSIPDLLFASLVAATFRKPVADWVERMYKQTGLDIFSTDAYASLFVVFAALSLITWPGYARLIRGQILSIREKEFVEAAIAIGSPQRKILLAHVIPNSLGSIIVAVTFGLAGAITAESSLSFLGVGAQPPMASWGTMIADNALSWRYRPWLVAVPGLTIAIISLGINFLGDGLNDALNPKSET